MIIGLVGSAGFLLAATVLLVWGRSAPGNAVRTRTHLPPRAVAGLFLVLGVAGVVNTASLEWFPEQGTLSAIGTALLVAAVVLFLALIAVAQRRHSAARKEGDGQMNDLFD
jgi:drug/metabolite transporter (DMT)-like permease